MYIFVGKRALTGFCRITYSGKIRLKTENGKKKNGTFFWFGLDGLITHMLHEDTLDAVSDAGAI